MMIVPTEKRFDWKHAPVVLFLIVMANILTFTMYQSGDSEKLDQALDVYTQEGFLELEWPAFQDYLTSRNEEELLGECRTLYDQESNLELSVQILVRTDFYPFISGTASDYIAEGQRRQWSISRTKINDDILSVSFYSLGLIPSQINALTLFTSQFLHSDIMHLVGNMFFLIICGFAVEAAIGHRLFLLFYLLSGLAGGLLYTAVNQNGVTPLVGASGAISGVMAMYLGVFRFRKIEFFYWFYIFVGYFRAPALLILPFYIGKEVVSFYSETGSNVAFMAHAGGFTAGGLLMLALALIRPGMLNVEYIEEDQDLDPVQAELARVYTAISNFQFQAALKIVSEIIEEHGSNFELAMLRYNLSKIDKNDDYPDYIRSLLKTRTPSINETQRLEKIWLENLSGENYLTADETIRLGISFSALQDPATAERIFQSFYKGPNKPEGLGVLARKLALIYGNLRNQEKQEEYDQLAESLLVGSS
jgi:membrane associated rhomboid family serine protease